MKISIGNLCISDYSASDLNKVRFARQLANDLSINKFVSSCIDEFLEDSENDSKLYVGPAYLVEDNNTPVGFIRMNSLSSGKLDLHYGVHPEYRNKGYGTKILIQMSSYIFKTMSHVEKIQLYIANVNYGSINCAKKAGFHREDIIVTPKYVMDVYEKERKI